MLRHRLALLIVAALLGLGLAGIAHAADSRPCPDGMPRVGDLGFRTLDCDCSFEMNGTSRRWRFRDEPRVGDVDDDGPAAGLLKEGDVIVSIDGLLITTSEAGRRLANVRAGVPVTLVIRRDDREITVKLTPGSTCLNNIPGIANTPMPPTPPASMVRVTVATPPAAPAPPAPPGTWVAPPTPPSTWVATPAPPAPPTAPTPPMFRRHATLPRGWFGVSLNCSECGSVGIDENRMPVWKFTDLPAVYIVEPGSPAARAGLQSGDVLTQINGVSLLSSEGGRLFGAVRPGQSVRFTVVRGGGNKHDVNVVAGTRPEDREATMSDLMERLRNLREMREQHDLNRLQPELARLEVELKRMYSAPEAMMAPDSRRLRYAGSVGGSDVEVHGLGNVVVDDGGDEIVITTRDATIRIRPSAGARTTTAAANASKRADEAVKRAMDAEAASKPK